MLTNVTCVFFYILLTVKINISNIFFCFYLLDWKKVNCCWSWKFPLWDEKKRKSKRKKMFQWSSVLMKVARKERKKSERKKKVQSLFVDSSFIMLYFCIYEWIVSVGKFLKYWIGCLVNFIELSCVGDDLVIIYFWPWFYLLGF